MMCSEYIVIRIMSHNIFNIAIQNITEFINRIDFYILIMERGTEYGLEQVFNVIDSRYRSGKPLIVTTNLTLDDLRNRRTPPIPGFMTGCFPCASRYALPATTSGRKPHSGKWRA